MMKKLFSVTAALLLLACLFSFSASAVTINVVSLDDTFDTLIYNGKLYRRFDDDEIDVGWVEDLPCQVDMTISQQLNIKRIELSQNEYGNVIFADVRYLDSTTVSVAFLRADCYSAYNDLVNGRCDTYHVDFYWPEGNTVDIAQDAVNTKNDVTLSARELEWAEHFYVSVQTPDGSLSIQTGLLITVNDEYYYADYDNNGLTWERFEDVLTDVAPLQASRITDQEAIAALDKGLGAYNRDMMLPFGDGAEVVTLIVCVLLFAVLPLVLFVLFLVLALRSGHPYRELCAAVCALAVAILLVFALTAFFLIAG